MVQLGLFSEPSEPPKASRARRHVKPEPQRDFVTVHLHEAWHRLRSAIEGAIEDLRNEVPGLPCQDTAVEVDIHIDTLDETITAAMARFERKVDLASNAELCDMDIDA